MIYRRREKAKTRRIYQAGYFKFNSTTGAGTWVCVGRGRTPGSARRKLIEEEAKYLMQNYSGFEGCKYEESYYDERIEA